jgi:hypothetical protein
VQVELGLDGNTNWLCLIVRNANGIVRHVCRAARPVCGMRLSPWW